jgi:PAS domain S-box-containing protein
LPVSLSSTAVKDASGNFIMSRSTFIDIRARKQAETALRDSEARFRSLTESSPIGIFMTDAQGRNLYTNPRAQEICGYTFAEALGDGWMRFVHPEDLQTLLNSWTTALVEQKGSVYEEIRYVHPDGTIRYGRVQIVPIFGEDGKLSAYMGSVEDITEQRAIAQMKNEFISIVSHELRTPLTAIRGSLGLLAAGVYNKKPEKGKRMLQVASEQTDRLVRLINDILDLQRLESDKMKLAMQVCDAATLMQQSVETMRASAEANQIQLIVLPTQVQVWAAPDSIIQTLTNLLSNAIKFSPTGGKIWLSAELRNKTEERAKEKAEGKRMKAEEEAESRRQKDETLSIPPSPLPPSPHPHLPVRPLLRQRPGARYSAGQVGNYF